MMEYGSMPSTWRGPIPEGRGLAERGSLSLTDFSRRRRFGVKGSGALNWLGDQALPANAENNQTSVTGDVLVARLAPNEALLLALDDGENQVMDNLSHALQDEWPANCYSVPRQDMSAWFRLSGEQSPQLMAQLCAIDLRPHRFAEGCIAQTSVAHQIAIVLRRDDQSEYGLDFIVDFAAAGYLWKILSGKATGWTE
jgi:sarcosine oxidase, subunit gamma